MEEQHPKKKRQHLPVLLQESSSPSSSPRKNSTQRVLFLLLSLVATFFLLQSCATTKESKASINSQLKNHLYSSRRVLKSEEKERMAYFVKLLLDKAKMEYNGATTDALDALESILQWTQTKDDVSSNEQLDILPSSLPSKLFPQFMAVQWLALDDKFTSSDNPNSYPTLLRRYALAVLYFATNGDEWHSCSRSSSLSPCNGVRFLANEKECSWKGIRCVKTGGTVWIELVSNNLSSSSKKEEGSSIIPAELSFLSKDIELLWLSNNTNLHGTIPNYIHEFTKLSTLNLFDTKLSGTIPETLHRMKELTSLRLYNTQLSGTIPSNMGNMKHLSWLWLHGCQLTGTVPTELGKLKELNALTLHANEFSFQQQQQDDFFPSEICLLKKKKNLAHLWTDCSSSSSTEGEYTCDCCTRCFVRNDRQIDSVE